ncbi:putative bifunctional diguanylate cyclase/phosphodiesterase [Acidicapsa ligni]|uniref:putative bifunctional diguanylate cyclase/phosphodiesterase n=1 Tax=Acidicapsa ligni TaxID=542300 RepID=UPI0021DF86BE|nr:EAL domain-containing protein [Acidicapsa ligni]
MVSRDLRLLHDVYAIDVQGIRLEGELQYEIQKSRRRFLRILLGTGKPDQLQREIQMLNQGDATVELLSSQVSQLGIPSSSQELFQQKWGQYKTKRDLLIKTEMRSQTPKSYGAHEGLGKEEFFPVEQAVNDASTAFEKASAEHIQEVSNALNGALHELVALLAITLASLSLLIWIDWKRIRTEKQLKRATHDLLVSESRFHQAYESASVGMGIFKLDGTILSMNQKAAEILGYEIDELIGTKGDAFVAPEFRKNHEQRIDLMPGSTEASYQAERKVIRKDGKTVWVRNSVALLNTAEGEPHFFSITEEITRQKEANDRLAYLANFDPVTNLPNLHYFEEILAAELEKCAPGEGCIALLYLEIDSFDFVKGTFGRTVADEILNEVGASLSQFRQEGEVIARLDDHVFGVLLRAAPYDEATLARATQLREVFHRASQFSKHRIPLSASIGIAYSSDAGRDIGSLRRGSVGADADTLLKYARAAMLEARSRGGDSIFLADPALQERAAQRHQIESALLRGLRENEFTVVFQPQFLVVTGRLVRFEALCRWHSAELGTIPPDRFIPIAEQTGLITEIGRRVLHEALIQARNWTDSGRRIGVAVNISPMQFMRPDFTHIITEILALTRFPPSLLELEITEGIFIRDLNLAVSRIRELQRLGLSVALDDFGTGYSSLSYLQRMPIDAVKLDRSFVRDLTTDQATVSMVRSVLAMAKALNLRVVTEGVETEQQLEILRSLGCDEAQGFLLGRPETAEMALRRVLESPLQSIGTLA